MLLNKICKDFPLKLSPQASELDSSSLMEKMQIGLPTPFPPAPGLWTTKALCLPSFWDVYTAETITESGGGEGSRGREGPSQAAQAWGNCPVPSVSSSAFSVRSPRGCREPSEPNGGNAPCWWPMCGGRTSPVKAAVLGIESCRKQIWSLCLHPVHTRKR